VHAARSARGPFEITQPAQTQILSRSPNSPPIAASPLLSPRRPSYPRAAEPRWFDTAPPILAGLVLLRRSSLVRYCSAVRRSSMDASQDGDGGQGGNGGGGQGGKTDHAHQVKKRRMDGTGGSASQATGGTEPSETSTQGKKTTGKAYKSPQVST
jgi:hypothetical protein